MLQKNYLISYVNKLKDEFVSTTFENIISTTPKWMTTEYKYLIIFKMTISRINNWKIILIMHFFSFFPSQYANENIFHTHVKIYI